MSTHVEWGVKHIQGIATYSSEREARQELPRHIRAWERSQAKFRPDTRPQIVSREVTNWSVVEDVPA